MAALAAREAVLQDFHHDPGDAGPVVRIGFFYPVRAAVGARAIAVLHANIDPYRSLVPMVVAWPSLAATAEILFLRPEGRDFELLNSPAARPDIAPLTRLSSVATADSLVTGEGNFSGRDYRGATVFAYGAAVEDTPWRLVAKLDVAEAYRHVNQLATVAGAGIALLLCLGCTGWAMHNRHVLLRYRQQLDSLVLAKRINYLAKYANDCITLADMHGRLLEVNDRGCRLYNYTAEEMAGMPITQLRAPGHQAEVPDLLERIAREGSLIYETVHRRKDGRQFPVEISTCLIDVGGRRCFQAVTRDISERRRLEQERVEHQRRINEISHRLVAVQEQERRMLAAELHDRTGANLAAISLNLKAVGQALPAGGSQRCKEILAETGQLLTDTIASVRNICSDLRPAILDYAGLVAALMDLGTNFTRRTGVVARVQHQTFSCQCPAETESLLYRIVQEALTNCAKHARASNVEIRLANDGEAAVLTVTDDGCGFVPGELGQSGRSAGLGLLIIRERAEFMGGRLSVTSRPGRGTQIKVEWNPGTAEITQAAARPPQAASVTAA
jgi:PAS domain S-box-containing protein